MSDLRLNNAVIRGEIDNTRMGTITAKFWLVDQADPVELELEGDCLRDLAGSHIHFTHRSIEPLQPMSLDWSTITHAHAGEITASSRLCMHRPNEVGGYDKPVLVNVLRLEFFCNLGRVLLESFDFSCFLINHTWNMSEEEDFAQRANNFSTWQAHIASTPKLDLAKDAQALANLYDEVQHRFADNFDFDQNEAALMSWNGILSALAEESEPDNKFLDPQSPQTKVIGMPQIDHISKTDLEAFENFLQEDLTAEENWESEHWEEEESGAHPLLDTVQELIEDFEVQAANMTSPRGRHYQRLINTLDDIEEGLTGLLNPTLINEMPTNTCIIGCREYLGKMMIAFHHFSMLLDITETKQGRRELLFLRDGLLDLREGISALRFEINNLQ